MKHYIHIPVYVNQNILDFKVIASLQHGELTKKTEGRGHIQLQRPGSSSLGYNAPHTGVTSNRSDIWAVII